MAFPRHLKTNPAYQIFFENLAKAKWSPWQGIAFRAAPLQYSRVAKLLDGRGALRFGGRWSAPGTFRAVNLSLSQETAVNESNSNFAHYGLPADTRPKVIAGVRLSLRKVLDLVAPDGLARERWLMLPSLLTEDWHEFNDAGCESMCQALGRAAHDHGADGLLVPSARIADTANLVFFPESLIDDASAEILGEDELDRWLKKR